MCQWADEQAPAVFQVAHISVTPPGHKTILLSCKISPLHNSRVVYHIFIGFVVQPDLL